MTSSTQDVSVGALRLGFLIDDGSAMALKTESLSGIAKIIVLFTKAQDGKTYATHLLLRTPLTTPGLLLIDFSADTTVFVVLEDGRLKFDSMSGAEKNSLKYFGFLGRTLMKKALDLCGATAATEDFGKPDEAIKDALLISDEEWQQLVTLTKQKIAEDSKDSKDAAPTPSASAST